MAIDIDWRKAQADIFFLKSYLRDINSIKDVESFKIIEQAMEYWIIKNPTIEKKTFWEYFKANIKDTSGRHKFYIVTRFLLEIHSKSFVSTDLLIKLREPIDFKKVVIEAIKVFSTLFDEYKNIIVVSRGAGENKFNLLREAMGSFLIANVNRP
ncbi:MAG: hypothetical protein K2X39_09845 [Silvanigrellaceae bacterium]|nr:hypothetical protein [Silvanigrellaceae bacterium]